MARTVLVTGASSGIGRACVERLAAHGWQVLAGARADADLEALARSAHGVEPIRLDVTDADQIAAAAEHAGGRLDGLVNNAGVAITGPVEALEPDDWRRQLETNLVGQVAVTHALLPALIAARGRIVNVSSIGGLVALPLFGPYSASKHALEAFTDALRRELRGTGVQVSAVEPGAVATPIWEKGIRAGDAVAARLDEAQQARYGGLIAAVRRQAERGAREGIGPDEVADAVEAALTASRPRAHTVVGREARLQAALDRLLPVRVMDGLIERALR